MQTRRIGQENVQAATDMQQNWEGGSEVWQNVIKGMGRVKWNINSKYIQENVLEGEDFYCP